MAIEQSILAWRNDATDQLHLLFSVTTTSVVNSTFSANHTFSRAFLSGTTPKVMGLNARKVGAGGVSAIANATAMSVYVRGASPSGLADETVVVEVTLEGGY